MSCDWCQNSFDMDETCQDEFKMWQGLVGPYYIPYVDEYGNISWTNTGNLPNPNPINIKGEKGDKLTYADLTEADKQDLIQGPIESAQTSAVSAVNAAGTSNVNAVNQAGATQIAAVNQAGTTQVQNVNTAGETQVQAVEDKGEEVLASIPEDYTDLSADVSQLKSQVNDTTTGLDTKAPVIINTASGDIASFSDGADSMPIKSLVANIEPVQEGSGDPSPDNIRPISGHTGMTVSHSGADMSNPEMLPISWQSEAGTVYGGQLAINEDGSCDLTVTHATYNQNQFPSYGKSGSTAFDEYFFRTTSGVLKPISQATSSKSIRCSHAKAGGVASADYVQSRIASSQPRILFPVGDMPSLTDFSAWLQEQETAGTLLQFWYELANAITYHLPSVTMLETLLGTNNVWCDTGDTAVEYRADTKLYIQKLTQPTEDDMTANENIAANKFFMLGNTLYYSTAAIAAGATIIPGTNCNMVSLADALNQLNT